MILEHHLSPHHAAADGHFPDNPTVPGGVLLAEVLCLIAAELRIAASPCRISSAKFPRPARPGDRLRIEVTGSNASHVRFSCAVDGVNVLLGEVQWLDSQVTT